LTVVPACEKELSKTVFMAVGIKHADLEKDRPVLIAMLRNQLTSTSDERRFNWLYCGSPWGPAKAWVATDHDQAIGLAAAFPRRIFCRGREQTGYVLGDFCIHPRYRSLGAAVQLQRACLSELISDRGNVYYDFPSSSMLAVYQRIGLRSNSSLLRMAKPLRVKFERFTKYRPIAGVLSHVANKILLHSAGPRQSPHVSISVHEGPFGKEFTALSQRITPSYSFCVVRSAEYLNWRFREHPFTTHCVITARRGAELLGYAILAQDPEHAVVMDMFGVNDRAVTIGLVAKMISIADSHGACTISLNLLEADERVNLLQRLGFRKRETKPVVICTGHPECNSPPPIEHYLLLNGDRES
jgi:hypothetical protein